MKLGTIIQWGITISALVIAAASWWLWMDVRARAARVDRIELHDQSGRVRIRLAASDAAGQIELIDEKGQVRLALRQEAASTAVRLNSTPGNVKAIEMLVEEGSAGKPTQATVSVFSDKGLHATLGASDSTWLKLRGPGGELSVTHRADRSELAATHDGKSVRYQIDASQSRFIAEMPMFVSLNP